MRRPLAVLLALLCPAALSACAGTTSSGSFKGVEHEVAQTVANLQSEATNGNEKKICGELLSSSIVTRLGGAAGCEAAIKTELGETDNLETTILSVHVAADGTTATADVSSLYRGKKRAQTLTLVKEDGKWKISGLQ